MKLSIIMPCFNVESTLIRALDSIWTQRVTFDYEVLMVDDASTDRTVELARAYAEIHPGLRIISNQENRGNAFSYYTGLCVASGDYFCVLDGDDYYTISDKLQRQVDFLDQDIAEEYVGVATQYIIDLGNNQVSIPERSTYKEFTYVDMLTQHSGYYHTATYMYRNIFRGNVPAEIGEVLYRGDTPRTMFHLRYSGKKIKILDFVGSAYTFEFGGLWSSLNQQQQFQYQINYQTKHREYVDTAFEKLAADRLIEFNEKKLESAQDDLRRYPAINIDEALKNIESYASKFAFAQKDFMLKHVYYSEYIDSLCESLGYILRMRNPELVQWRKNENHVCIVNGVLSPQGGGIFAEISELIQIYKSKQVYLFVSNMAEVPKEARDILSRHSNLSIICPPKDTEERLYWLYQQMVNISPYRCYYYCSHRDVYGASLAQKGICENVAFFSFDHGYLTGISNSSIDYIIAKRPVDYWMLRKKFRGRVLFIPTWNDGAKNCDKIKYEPFRNHIALNTACGAARYYKVDGRIPYRYVDYIVDLLKMTGGKHYHFGEIPDEVRQEIADKMDCLNVPSECFVHIPWSENIPLELLENDVDIFIEPFPVVSYKLTLEVLSVGVPVIVREGLTRMSVADFVPEDTLTWRSKKEFLDKLLGLNKELLREASKNAKFYFDTHHSIEQVSKHLFTNNGLLLEEKRTYPDDTLIDIGDSLRLFSNDFRIMAMKNERVLDKTKREAQEKARQKKLKEEQQERKKEEDKRIKKKILEIRSCNSFKLGNFLTFPLRFCKQMVLYTCRFGLFKGFKQLKTDGILFYHRKSSADEYYTLSNSIAYRTGKLIALPYKKVRYALYHKFTEKKQRSEQQKNRQLDLLQSCLEKHDENQKAFEESLKTLLSFQENLEKFIYDYKIMEKKAFLDNQKVLYDLQILKNEFYNVASDLKEKDKNLDEIIIQNHSQVLNEVRFHEKISREALWAHIYSDTVKQSKWFNDSSVSPGRWAVGYPFLYVLYRVLEQLEPKSILEMGLGQSTKMITQYVAHHEDVKHTVVEQDSEWVRFFEEENQVALNTNICVLECEMVPYHNADEVRVYKGFKEAVGGNTYDIICIDAPSAEGMDKYSRIDVLSILPDGLNDQFVILLDDCNRIGEGNTAEEISNVLTTCGVDFAVGKYQGEKLFYIWVSRDLEFLCTL